MVATRPSGYQALSRKFMCIEHMFRYDVDSDTIGIVSKDICKSEAFLGLMLTKLTRV